MYNPKVVDKMTLQQYLDIGKNINNGDKPVSNEELTKYYYDI